MRKIELHIEELILHGFASGDRYRIGNAMEQELSRLLSQEELPPVLVQEGVISKLDGGTLQVKPGSTPETIGMQVAQNLYGGLKR